MARATPAYRKLPGTGSGVISRHKLYLAADEDNLMCISQEGFTEYYARFELNDIQAICARETSGWKVAMAITGLLLALCILLAFALGSLGWSLFLGIMGTAFGIVILYNLIAGATCETTLYTAVSAQQLRSLHRIRTFHKVSAIVAPLIEGKQGRLDPNELRAAEPVPEEAPEKPSGERATLWLSLALLADAALAGLLFWLDDTAIAILRLIDILLITGLVVMGFAKIPRKRANRALRLPIWAGFVYVILAYSFFYTAFIIGSMDSVLPTATAFDAVLPSSSPVSFWCNIVLLVTALILGTGGLLAVASARTKE